MEFNIIIGLLSGISIVSIGIALFTRAQYKNKKSGALSLEEQIKKYNDDLGLLDNSYNEKSKEIASLSNIHTKKIEEVGKVESLLIELKSKLDAKKIELEDINSHSELKQKELSHLIKLEKEEDNLKNSISELHEKMDEIILEIETINNNKSELLDELNDIKKDISLYTPSHDLTNIGFFEVPKYLFETSERFKEEIKFIRDKQKELIQRKEAIILPTEIAITDDLVLTKKITQGQAQIMLKAFNIETDLLLDSLKISNFAMTLERIEKVATNIEKSAISLKCGFSEKYIELKYKECELQYQFKIKQDEEREEQKAIKEQMKEEQKAIREFERVVLKAEKEEKLYQDALEQAKMELSISNDKENEKLNSKILMLELRLKEAIDNSSRAKSMAEQTRRGHVYIISNIGSFGENIYKIGMTRRLEPLDRVKELGDASVPFSFDVHAMIFNEDAPTLEKELHRAFTHKRLNAVNHRKEFFNVDLIEIKNQVNIITGSKSDFIMTALAEDYYESKRISAI